MGNTKTYWKGVEQLNNDPEFVEKAGQEFPEEIPVEEFLSSSELDSTSTNRRDFLKFMGFSLAAATLAACETPVVKSIPYVNKPEDVTPGVANWYSSTYYDGSSFANILVKTREGRPIHIKGNKSSGLTNGAINPRINSSVLGLYEAERLKTPMINGADGWRETSWVDADYEVTSRLQGVVDSGGSITVLTNSIISPTTKKAIGEFTAKYGKVNHVTYDAISYSGIRSANNGVIPSYDFGKAKVIVSVAADFLGTWLSSNEYTTQYVANRNPDADWMSKHMQFETVMSITGANADHRAMIKPSEEGTVAVALYNAIASKMGAGSIAGGDLSNESAAALVSEAADALVANEGASLVVGGSNDPAVQQVIAGINELLGNNGSTVDLDNGLNLWQADDQEVMDLVKDMEGGNVGGLIIYGVNPAYSLPNGAQFQAALKNVSISVSLSAYADETASHCSLICPDNHYLESWNDLEPKDNHYCIVQPAISPLHDTRQAQESFLRWAGNMTSMYDYMRTNWEADMYTRQSESAMFSDFWNWTVHNGSVMLSGAPAAVEEEAAVEAIPVPAGDEVAMPEEAPEDTAAPAPVMDLSSAASSIQANSTVEGTEIYLYQKTAIGDGSQGNNPWLQEMADPISQVTWDNYVTMSLSDMEEAGYNTQIGQEWPATLVTVTVGENSIDLPVYPSPGQCNGTVGIALGYGRGAGDEKIGKAAYQTGEYGAYLMEGDGETEQRMTIGRNAFPFVTMAGGCMSYSTGGSITDTGETYLMAATQTHHTIMGRDSIIREVSAHSQYVGADKEEYNPAHTLLGHDPETGHAVEKPISEFDLWEAHPVENIGHRWGMKIDLNNCIGCGACLTACVSENNVPVVGKDEVRRVRTMSWLRIDRYFSSDATHEDGYAAMERASDNPKVVFQPMMCQHCNHAPCETVCPVLATTHSNEGLNMMAYNRCIGTRYCANNCPYKVRRFNWFNYPGYSKFEAQNPAHDAQARWVLNPDVVVRTRGVMEKCSMCVQQIQAGKLDAKKDGRKVMDGEIQTACAAACGTNAITFGDLNDSDHEIAKVLEEGTNEHNRAYNVLEEVGVKPNIYYMVKVRNGHEEEVAVTEVDTETVEEETHS